MGTFEHSLVTVASNQATNVACQPSENMHVSFAGAPQTIRLQKPKTTPPNQTIHGHVKKLRYHQTSMEWNGGHKKLAW